MFKFIFVCIASILLLTGCSSKEQNIQNNSSAQKTSATQNEIIKNNDSLKNSTNDTNNVKKENAESSSKKTPTEKELATFSTKILVKESGRQHNLHLTCDTLNGTRIEPGETFSFCNTVGKATKEKGYEEADVYDSEGNVTKGLGGGNCQISSTLYNTALIAGFEITERHAHSARVYYVPKDKDATILYGSLDLKFINNTDSEVKIIATNDNANVTIKLVKLTQETKKVE